jgi:hypothetical protein
MRSAADPHTPTHPLAAQKGELVVDVYDWDRIGSDDHLGMLKFDGAEILKLTEKSKTTAELGLDDEALTIIENEWKRLEGTPLEKDFKLNILHKIDEEARAERERLKLANEEEERRKLQEKVRILEALPPFIVHSSSIVVMR